MKLYHGTTEAVARRAIKEGLLPRNKTGSEGNWEHTVASDDSRIYLTRGYAPYFAFSAVEEGEKWGIVEVDVQRLANDISRNIAGGIGDGRLKLLPDEDFLEQAARGMTIEHVKEGGTEEQFKNFPWDGDYVEKTEFFRNNILKWQHMWEASLDRLGSCSLLGGVHPRAISRVSIYDPKSNPTMTLTAIDPIISIQNWGICSEKYSELTRWFMGYTDIDPARLFMYGRGPDNGSRQEALETLLREKNDLTKEAEAGLKGQLEFFRQENERLEAWNKEVIPNRSGIEIIDPFHFGTGDMTPPLKDKESIIRSVVDGALPLATDETDERLGAVMRDIKDMYPKDSDEQLKIKYNLLRGKWTDDLFGIWGE